MILAIDIGNTNIVLGGFEGETILFIERISTNQAATDLEYASDVKTALDVHNIDPKEVQGAILSSVVPSVTNTFQRAVQKYLNVSVTVVEPGMKTGLSIVINNPAQLGSDLIVGAVAGIQEYSLPLIIIDMGTATTLSVINRNKQYLGGIIMPGVGVSHDSLIARTAQLPKIALEPPKHVIGKNTIDCMKSGLLFGTACSLDGLIDRIQAELGEPCTVVATGGLATVIVPLCKHPMILDDDLLLKGLMILYHRNQ